MQLVRVHPEIGGDVGGRRRRDRQQLRNAAGHPLLHLQEAVPPAHRRFTPPPRRGEVQHAIAGDRVVHGRHHGHAGLGDGQQADAQTLVVVHDVEVAAPIGQQARGTQAEGARLGEARRPHRGQFEQVDAVPDLAGMRDAERVGLAIHVEAGHLGQHDPGVEFFGVGLAGEHLDVVSQFDQSAAEVADVNALAAAVRLAAIGQQRNPHTHARSGADAEVRDHGERFGRGVSGLSGHVSGL